MEFNIVIWFVMVVLGTYLLVNPASLAERARRMGLDLPILRRAKTKTGRLKLRLMALFFLFVIMIAEGSVRGLLPAEPLTWLALASFILLPAFCVYAVAYGVLALLSPEKWLSWRYNLSRPYLEDMRNNRGLLRLIGAIFVFGGLWGFSLALSPAVRLVEQVVRSATRR